MRIAWVVPGGMDRSARERVIPVLLWQVERLAARHEVHVISLREDTTDRAYPLLGATVHVLPRGRLGSRARAFLSLLRALGSFDVIHVFWAGNAALLAALAGRWRQTPVILSLAGGELVALPDIAYGRALTWTTRASVRAALRLATRVTVASGPMEELAKPLRSDVLRVPLGVDLRRFAPSAAGATAPPAGPPWRLLHVASINEVKDQATLLRAFRRVVDAVGDVSLDIIGVDTLHGAVERLARDLDLVRVVRFHGFLPIDVVAPFYRAAHVFLLTSRHEAGPIVVLEAGACGVPTVGTAVGHVADLAPDAAWAVPVRDAEALALGVVTLLGDEARRRRLGEAARAWVARYDADWTAGHFEAIYQLVRRERS